MKAAGGGGGGGILLNAIDGGGHPGAIDSDGGGGAILFIIGGAAQKSNDSSSSLIEIGFCRLEHLRIIILGAAIADSSNLLSSVLDFDDEPNKLPKLKPADFFTGAAHSAIFNPRRALPPVLALGAAL